MFYGLTVIGIDGKNATSSEHFCGNNSAFAKTFRSWGELEVVHKRRCSNPKISDRGTVCMMVRYNHDLGGNVYRMWHLGTNRVNHTRYIIWLKKMYHKTTKQDAEIINSKTNVGIIKVKEAIDDAI